MPHSNNLCYDFDSFRLDVDQRVLSREGKAVPLTPKATEILILLLKNAGQLVEKDELMKEVWPDSFVEEANVAQNIFTLRRALGEAESGKRYIETVARRGYRFVADVTLWSEPSRGGRHLASLDDASLLRSPPSLAVLPFVNATGGENYEYLAEGITDNLTNNLSRIDKLRIISRSSVFRHRSMQSDPQEIGSALGVDAILSGRIQLRDTVLVVSVELIEVNSGWQLWGESFDLSVQDILEVQDEIARQISATLRLKLTGEEEKRITTRYTENSSAYQAYLEGRYHWSKYTKLGIEKAIVHFREAIELDPNYALAYSGIVDCYLRLATNYLPPEGGQSQFAPASDESSSKDNHDRVELRHEWDWKSAQRELRRANDVKSDYPSALQWYSAYSFASELSEKSLKEKRKAEKGQSANQRSLSRPKQVRSLALEPNEQLQILCAVAREQIEVGNFEAAEAVLGNWAEVGRWPSVAELSVQASADLLFTVGTLTGCVASAKQLSSGQKHCEALLNGSLALYEQQGASYCASEVRLELATCYYRQGVFELARDTIKQVLNNLGPNQEDLLGIALVRLAIIERHAGRLHESHSLLIRCTEIASDCGPWVSSRYNQELATTLRYLALIESNGDYFEEARNRFRRALYEFEAIGNHRYAAVVQNNYGYLLLCLNKYDEAEFQLTNARKRFDWLDDRVRRAQVDDTLAQLYIAMNKLDEAEEAIENSIRTLEVGDEEAILAESLTTKASLRCKQERFGEAKGLLEGAHRIAKHCGDIEREAKTLVMIVEEMTDTCEPNELLELKNRLSQLLNSTLQKSTGSQVERCLELLAGRHLTRS